MNTPTHEDQTIDSSLASRMRRALALRLTRVTDGQYRVEGSTHDFYVQTRPHRLCVCPDAAYRTVSCKHLLAGLLADGDEEARSLARAVLGPQAGSAALRRTVWAEDDLPAGEPLAEMLAVLALSPDDAMLASRILTDPGVRIEQLRKLARTASDPTVLNTMASLPAALQDKKVRAALARTQAPAGRLIRLLPHAEAAEFRQLFARLLDMSMGAVQAVLSLLEDEPGGALPHLQPPDLLPLLEDPRPDIRERAITLISRLAPDARAEEPQRPTLQPPRLIARHRSARRA